MSEEDQRKPPGPPLPVRPQLPELDHREPERDGEGEEQDGERTGRVPQEEDDQQGTEIVS